MINKSTKSSKFLSMFLSIAMVFTMVLPISAFAATNDFAVDIVDAEMVTFSFTAPAGASSVKIQQSTNGIDWTDSIHEPLIELSTSAAVIGLDNGTNYSFKLVVQDGLFDGDSNIVTAMPVADMTVYDAAIAAVAEADYTTASWSTYQAVVAANEVTEHDTQADVIAATDAITAAQGDLVAIADMTAYDLALAAVAEADYTTATWSAYQDVVAANVVSNQNTQAEVDAATAAITAAQGDLVAIADMTAYDLALAAVAEADYTTATWSAYQDVVAANVVSNQNTQAEVDAATAAITAAQGDLVAIADMTAYDLALAAVAEADYTTATWSAYQDVVAANVVSNQNTQAEVDAATAAITAAQGDLVAIADMTAYDLALAAVAEADYTTATWSAYQDVVAANVVSNQNTQAEVDAATAAITAAQGDLVAIADMTAYDLALAAVAEADYTTATWSAYQDVVAANVVSNQNTQAEVDAATAAITAAQGDLVAIADMTAYDLALAAVAEADYTTATWSAYQDVVAANVVSNQNTQAEVDAATAAITAAQGDLVAIADMTAYDLALAAVAEADYTTATWSAYQDVVAANVVSNQNTQAEVDAATAAITAAQGDLVAIADMTAYDLALAAVAEADYTTATWSAYQDVVAANVVSNQNTQAEVDAATAAITAAQGDLVAIADMTAYDLALAAVAEADYTTATWSAYQDVVAANVVSNQNTQAEVDAATAAITAAQGDLVAIADMTAYDLALAAVAEADYTTATWSAYQDVVAANVVSNQNTQAEVDAATAAITAAQGDLVAIADMTAYDLALAAVAEADYTTATWSAYQDVVAANVVSNQNTQAEVDAATAAITAAQGDLVAIADMTAYDLALAAVAEADYTTATWSAYQDVVAANVVSNQNTQAEVDAATAAITAAQGDLVAIADMTAYDLALAAVAEADYTTATWSAYQDVVAANVVSNQNTQAEVDAATAAITAAQGDLVAIADMTAYDLALAAVAEADYTTATWSAYQDVVAANVVSNQNTQAEVDAATAAITAAQGDLVAVSYAVTVADVVGATVNVDKATAEAGETVTVSIANIEAGRLFESITVTDADSDAVATIEGTVGESYTFTMPKKAVTVTVELETIPGYIINIDTANTLLVGDYAFELNDASYTLDNYLTAAQTVYNNGQNHIYYFTGSAWYDLVNDPDLNNPINHLNTINGDGMYQYMNMVDVVAP